MKKNIILAVSLFASFIFLVLIVHFFAKDLVFKEKTYTYGSNDVSFTTNEWLIEGEDDELDFYYYNFTDTVMVTLTKESKKDLSDLEFNLDLKGYTDIIYSYGNYKTNEIKQSDKGYYYFTYMDKDEEFFYMAAMYESDSYFYLMDFGCDIRYKKEYEKKFLDLADSVKIDENNNVLKKS